MRFINRRAELDRLERLLEGPSSALAVVYGRRRIGKTRLLLEWVKRHQGNYCVADQSAESLQREYFAQGLSRVLPGFDEVAYPSWASLLSRLARDAQQQKWRGPLVFDELPYLVAASPSLPSVLQRWIDHEARDAGLVIAIAGSSQRMMHGVVLDGSAPLFGRASEVIELGPIAPRYLLDVFPGSDAIQRVERFAAWGGVPRYWELAEPLDNQGKGVLTQIDDLVLNPLGPLHREPDRLLLEESPPAIELRPLLDAIGGGAHRVSEIAGRIGRPVTSMTRPLERLCSLSLTRREVPFGEPERKSRRGLYRIDDPFLRHRFRVVAPHGSELVHIPRRSRLTILARHWSGLLSASWEQLCRLSIPTFASGSPLRHTWSAASRWWRGSAPEWDIVAPAIDAPCLLLGEAEWSPRPFGRSTLTKLAAAVARRAPPELPSKYRRHETLRVLFVPRVAEKVVEIEGVHLLASE